MPTPARRALSLTCGSCWPKAARPAPYTRKVSADLLLHLLARFIHIISAILLLGGVFYARQVLVPVLSGLPSARVELAAGRSQSRFRTTLWTLLALIVLSGLYN